MGCVEVVDENKPMQWRFDVDLGRRVAKVGCSHVILEIARGWTLDCVHILLDIVADDAS